MLNEYIKTLRSFNRDVLLYLLSGALVGFSSSSGIYNLLLNIYVLRLGHSIEFIGVMSAVGAGSYALLCLPAGAMGRRWGVRPMIVLGLTFVAIGNLMLPVAEFVPQRWQAEWIILARIPRAFGFALSMVNASPFLIAITAVKRTHVFSVQAATWLIAGFAGNLIGGVLPGMFATFMDTTLDDPAAYRYPLFLAGAMMIPAAIAVAATSPSAGAATVEETAPSPLPWGPIAIIAIVGFCTAMGVASVQTFFNVYLDDELEQPTALIGALVACGMLVSGVAALATPFLVSAWGQRRAIVASTLMSALGLLPIVLFRHWSAAGFSFVAIYSLVSIRSPVFTIFHQEIVAPRWRPAMSAASSMSIGCCFMTTGLVGGPLIPALGYNAIFTFGAVSSLIGIAVFAAYFRSGRVALLRARAA